MTTPTTNTERPPDGEPAFAAATCGEWQQGLSIRDYFAAAMQADDRLVKCIRAMDDVALEMFARFPSAERDEWITETGPLEGETKWHGMNEVEKVIARLKLEAKAIAITRYMQADAMIAARNGGAA